MRLSADKRHSDHFDETLNPEKLNKYTEQIWKELKLSHKELTSNNFDLDKYKRRRSSIPVTRITTFPNIEKNNTEVNFKLKKRIYNNKIGFEKLEQKKEKFKGAYKSLSRHLCHYNQVGLLVDPIRICTNNVTLVNRPLTIPFLKGQIRISNKDLKQTCTKNPRTWKTQELIWSLFYE